MARVLLITEDEALARMTLWILAEQKHDATSCADTDKALGIFRDTPPDIVLLDSSLGDARCRDVERMYAALPGLQIVGLHGQVHGSGVRHIRAEGHLHKPFHADDLLCLVNELLVSR